MVVVLVVRTMLVHLDIQDQKVVRCNCCEKEKKKKNYYVLKKSLSAFDLVKKKKMMKMFEIDLEQPLKS